MNKVIPFIAFSVLLLVPVGSENAFAGSPSISFDDLLNGATITVEDKLFDNWSLTALGSGCTGGGTGDINHLAVEITALADDPINPGLKFTYNEQVTSASTLAFSYRISTLSGEPLIKDNSLELTEFNFNSLEGLLTIDEIVDTPGPDALFKFVSADAADDPNYSNLFDSKTFSPTNELNIITCLQWVPISFLQDGVSNIMFEQRFSQISPESQVIGGEIIPIESTSLLLAGAQSFSWMIPVTLSILGIGLFVVYRKK